MSDSALHRVKSVTVKKLFGIYDHSISLRLDERVTIIHGPNGVGKTMILKLLSALFSGRLHEFGRVPLEHFEVQLTDGTTISVSQARSRPKAGGDKSQHIPLRLTVTGRGETSLAEDLKFDLRDRELWARRLQMEVPWLEPVAEDRWLDTRSMQYLATSDVISIYSEVLMGSNRKRLEILGEPDWFVNIRTQVNVHIIETQRLLRLAPSDSVSPRRMASAMVPTVRDYAKDLQLRVTETLARYASESQSLDQSFPQRLLRARTTELSIADIKTRMAELDAKRAKLKSIGLLDDNAAYPFDITSLDNLDGTQRSVMTLYVQDTAQKLGVLDDLSRRVELLRLNVNGKFKHKSIRFDRESGFTASGADGVKLDLDALSSGEQHELVLLYDLLFKVQPNTLVLIDEPELSLHVLWQKRFLPDLLEIVQTARFDALVATHSPFIVGSHHSLMVSLSSEDE